MFKAHTNKISISTSTYNNNLIKLCLYKLCGFLKIFNFLKKNKQKTKYAPRIKT